VALYNYIIIYNYKLYIKNTLFIGCKKMILPTSLCLHLYHMIPPLAIRVGPPQASSRTAMLDARDFAHQYVPSNLEGIVDMFATYLSNPSCQLSTWCGWKAPLNMNIMFHSDQEKIAWFPPPPWCLHPNTVCFSLHQILYLGSINVHPSELMEKNWV
jgi:hypothetical protein